MSYHLSVSSKTVRQCTCKRLPEVDPRWFESVLLLYLKAQPLSTCIVRREANIYIASNYRNPQKFQLQLSCNSHRNKIHFIPELEATRTIVWIYIHIHAQRFDLACSTPEAFNLNNYILHRVQLVKIKQNRGFCLYYTRICKLTNSTDVISTIRVTSCMSLATFGGFSVTYSQSSANTTNLNCLL